MNIKEFKERAIRHGEIMLIPLDKLPARLEKIESSRKVIIGHSETGHHHVAVCGMDNLTLLRPIGADSSDLYLEVSSVAQVEHLKPFDRHETKVLQPGHYFVNIKQQWDYFAKRALRVLD